MKTAQCEPLNNTRELVKFLNQEEISMEDIVDIIPTGGQFMLVYYKQYGRGEEPECYE